ncbi:hypothetical protein [Micromonospora carbonacea]|uniref:Uncharacterized protein n=1 Tax=Micromonospora carbonacea TaxID=47853 RepID=A0A1C5A9Z4_9ACTN|nr:hypothetical protein [Micromonospora carbonacea]SCF42047.1 hypothetical protein GA0070563_11231 [Micromonospora carbonacea]
MAEPHLDNPGEIRWFKSEHPLPVLGPCPHAGCQHLGQGVIAWGPSYEHYELVECGITDDTTGCAAQCRSWVDGHGRVTAAWLHVDTSPAAVSG